MIGLADNEGLPFDPLCNFYGSPRLTPLCRFSHFPALLSDPDIFFWWIAIAFPTVASLLSIIVTLIDVRRRGLPALATMKEVGDAINQERGRNG